MAPSTSSLLTLAQLRERRGAMTEQDLMHRCRDAARLELRGSMFSPDDRLDVASQIMADGLTATGGTVPNASDPRHSLGSYCKRAQTLRRSLQRQRDRDNSAAESEQDEAAWSIDALTPDAFPSEGATVDDAMHAACFACERLGFDVEASPMMSLFYGAARDLPSAVVAAELGISPNAYDIACCRARSTVRWHYPTAVDLLTALVGEPTLTIDPMTGEPVWRYVVTDASREAHDRTHLLAQDWREGTDAGSWPTRPESIADARAVCEVRYRRAAPKTAEQARKVADRKAGSSEQAEADALRRIGYALARR